MMRETITLKEGNKKGKVGLVPAKTSVRMLDFSAALLALKAGARVARAGWNGKGMFLYLVPGSEFHVSRAPLLGIYPRGTLIKYHAHIDMKTATGDCVPWLCSQTDMLAEDWEILPTPVTEGGEDVA
jgi:hypothetical protein